MVLGRGGALGAVLFFVVIRGGLAVLVGGLFDHTTPHFPLYLVEGMLVEAVALTLGTQRALRFGLVSGGLIGTVGTLAEWGWSHAWMPLPWPGHMIGEALALTLPTGLAAGLLGAFAAGGLLRRPEVTAGALGRRSAIAAVLVIAATAAYLAPTSGGDDLRAAVGLQPAGPGRVVATVRFNHPERVRDADWLSSLAWQGRAKLHNRPLREVSAGVFRSSPMPVGGTWKTLLRLHKGSTLAALPVFLPRDTAIPAAGVAAARSFDRVFMADSRVLQRERKTDVPGWLWGTAGLVVLGFFAALLCLMGWAFTRVARTGGPPAAGHQPRTAPGPAPRVPAGAGA